MHFLTTSSRFKCPKLGTVVYLPCGLVQTLLKISPSLMKHIGNGNNVVTISAQFTKSSKIIVNGVRSSRGRPNKHG